uniref:Osteoclast stimulatory transmembrane protein-like n=1 Tax=Salmo trutta TaxID=8032 RepID=A0A673YHW9_SALTR
MVLHPHSHLVSAQSSFKRRLSSTLTFQWGVYSKPSPTNKLEVFNLFCFCLIVGAALAGLLHVWMVYGLNYQPFPSMVVSSTWGCIIVLLLFLLHPVRCVLSISVPSLGTKQGRKILVSTALVVVVTSCIPNMTKNLSRSVDMINAPPTGDSLLFLRYLTDLKHDNVYQTGRLQELLRARGVEEFPEAYRKRLVRTRGWRMTQRELRRCLWGGTILGFYCLVCALVLGLDHLIYSVLQTSLSWAQDIPEVNTTISLHVKVSIFNQNYHLTPCEGQYIQSELILYIVLLLLYLMNENSFWTSEQQLLTSNWTKIFL